MSPTTYAVQFPPDMVAIGRTRAQFIGYGGIPMTTVKASFGHVDPEDVIQGRAIAVEIVATSDGRQYVGKWHDPDVDGDFSDESVYVEKYDATGRTFHGWIDSVSRKLTQTG